MPIRVCASARKSLLMLLVLLLPASHAVAAPVSYKMDPEHTFPSFEADHMGVSIWRGKFDKTRGTMLLDRAAGTGSVDVVVDIASVNFGHEKMKEHALAKEFFDVEQYPTASYKGKLTDFVGGYPTRLVGDLTLHGVTRPVEMKIGLFKCIPHPMLKRELCGGDALAVFKRDEFKLDAGKAYGFNMDVTLRIQMEAIAAE